MEDVLDLSIIIPVFNESSKIEKDVFAAADFLCEYDLSGEIIVSDDGSTDDTADKVKAIEDPHGVDMRLLSLQSHLGKGAAVKEGILASSGRYVMFSDSGCCIGYEQAMRGLKLIENKECDLAFASRKLPDSVIKLDKGLWRRFCSFMFRLSAILIARVPADLTDTQCGFKIFKGDVARKIFSECKTEGFLFDVEIVLRAAKYGYIIREFPVSWYCDLDSRLSAGQSTFGILRDLFRLRRIVR